MHETPFTKNVPAGIARLKETLKLQYQLTRSADLKQSRAVLFRAQALSLCVYMVVVDSTGRIKHVYCGFLDSQNDVYQFRLMQQIGVEDQLPFPGKCALVVDNIFFTFIATLSSLLSQQFKYGMCNGKNMFQVF